MNKSYINKENKASLDSSIYDQLGSRLIPFDTVNHTGATILLYHHGLDNIHVQDKYYAVAESKIEVCLNDQLEKLTYVNNIQKELVLEVARIISDICTNDKIDILHSIKIAINADDEVVFIKKELSGKFYIIVGGDSKKDVTYGFVSNRPGIYDSNHLESDDPGVPGIVNLVMKFCFAR